MEAMYALRPTAWTLHDAPNKERREQLAFHIRSGDYFGTLASILRLLEEPLRRPRESRAEILKRLHEDLDYLQNHYRITHKNDKEPPNL
jgi:hypothetical protein